MAQLIAAVEERRDFIGVNWVRKGESDRTVRVIDYACGPGTISRVSRQETTGKGGGLMWLSMRFGNRQKILTHKKKKLCSRPCIHTSPSAAA